MIRYTKHIAAGLVAVTGSAAFVVVMALIADWRMGW